MSYEISLRPYDVDVIRLMRLFADDFAIHSIDRAYVRQNPKVAVKIWRNAQRIVGTGAQWGALVPGVSLDCIGSVITIVHMSGLYNIPKGVYAKLGTSPHRGAMELNKSAAVLFKRMVAVLAIMVWKYPCEGCFAIPVWNPKQILPGDILLLPNYTVINGLVTMPHSIVAVGNDKILTTNPESGVLQILDGNVAQFDNAALNAVNNCDDVVFALRLVTGCEQDADLAKHHVAACLERIRELARGGAENDFLSELVID